ncbi:DNA gyrase inhibitor YacG [Gimesia panareensis]|uniref:DNA gyrase inhibitor YacG n=1 Tax=Gimesia panareensis TaxID=2527978 RepID=A0A518AD09_9PLAN|nr:DNA gyrase inhibitor YacG [Gimesia panareensis]QDT29573.1 zinc-binding protein [Gimesia panareensis]QDU52617.1 zinc-binding protein [Gimesia panareensis]
MIQPQTCPICRKVVTVKAGDDQSAFPFCSKKCRDVDFFRWSEGRYAIVEELDPRLIELQRLEQEGEQDY